MRSFLGQIQYVLRVSINRVSGRVMQLAYNSLLRLYDGPGVQDAVRELEVAHFKALQSFFDEENAVCLIEKHNAAVRAARKLVAISSRTDSQISSGQHCGLVEVELNVLEMVAQALINRCQLVLRTTADTRADNRCVLSQVLREQWIDIEELASDMLKIDVARIGSKLRAKCYCFVGLSRLYLSHSEGSVVSAFEAGKSLLPLESSCVLTGVGDLAISDVWDFYIGEARKAPRNSKNPEAVCRPANDTQMVTTSQKLPSIYRKDWDAIAKEIDLELKAEEEEAANAARTAGGEESLHRFLREIYEKADDDTKRAMNKSFITSGGTVLSTNWAEVSGTDYEKKNTK